MGDNEAHRNNSIATIGDQEAEECGPITTVATTRSDESGPGKLNRATTWYIKSSKVIRDFVYQVYASEHYKALAEQAKSLIEAKLKHLRDADDNEVQAKVTCRAKDKKRLEEKLKLRELERGKYNEFEDIVKDVKDLAGVRIILYTPTKAQYDSVGKLVTEIWGADVEEKRHVGSQASSVSTAEQIDVQKKEGYIRKHLGYQATHYRPLMKKEHETEAYTYRENDWVEIQVCSAFGHAWAEAGHDVLYKSYAFGPPTKQEERILDALSGMVSTGDLLLEQFRELVNKRTYAKWETPEDFAIFLRQTDVLEKLKDEYAEEGEEAPEELAEGYRADFSPATAAIIFRFLVVIGKNYPLAVRDALRYHLGYNHSPVRTLEDLKKLDLNENLAIPKFNPHIDFPRGRLAPFCLILVMLQLVDRESQSNTGNTTYGLIMSSEPELTIEKKCRDMMETLILLQTFAGSPRKAKETLDKLELTDAERESMNVVLKDIDRVKILEGQIEEFWNEELSPAWEWFERQVADNSSLCGLLFRLVRMGVAKEEDDKIRLSELQIEAFSLSRANTFQSK